MRHRAEGFVSILCLCAVIFPAIANAGKQGSDHFRYQRTTTVMKQIAGDPFGYGQAGGNPRQYRERVWLNRDGGAHLDLRQLRGYALDRHPRIGCNLSERLAIVVVQPIEEKFCGSSSRLSQTMIDLSLVPRTPVPVSAAAPFSSLGDRIDDLGNRGRAIRRAIRDSAGKLEKSYPEASAASLRFEAALVILTNPLIKGATRRRIYEMLSATESVSKQVGATDPRGRKATLLTLHDQSRAGVVYLQDGSGGVREYDLKGSVELAHELYFSPATKRLLSARRLLVKADPDRVPELAEWLDDEGTPATIQTENFGTATSVVAPRYAQKKVSCKRLGIESDGTCIQIGRPGGPMIVSGG